MDFWDEDETVAVRYAYYSEQTQRMNNCHSFICNFY